MAEEQNKSVILQEIGSAIEDRIEGAKVNKSSISTSPNGLSLCYRGKVKGQEFYGSITIEGVLAFIGAGYHGHKRSYNSRTTNLSGLSMNEVNDSLCLLVQETVRESIGKHAPKQEEEGDEFLKTLSETYQNI